MKDIRFEVVVVAVVMVVIKARRLVRARSQCLIFIVTIFMVGVLVSRGSDEQTS